MISGVHHVENEAWNMLQWSKVGEKKEEKGECNLLWNKGMLTGNIVLVPGDECQDTQSGDREEKKKSQSLNSI